MPVAQNLKTQKLRVTNNQLLKQKKKTVVVKKKDHVASTERTVTANVVIQLVIALLIAKAF
ncbi:hypothetical protein P872_20825 [Rhodonellum psychrophilum GCM71 = DSM 17998]|uniref:Uncharacterized protein n=2 Tax=Rhodonellum TaxID=336827 RepID=U5BKW3_9BACT|nr:hypothetical protein P872_20825 [Rhodonellum psychrophilum GCM71 = DSM 17998]SDZ51637.1 hypothetical protein SAMN05444412_11948 [Rhodonellum ikkaensis]